jgi:hypothetical protein
MPTVQLQDRRPSPGYCTAAVEGAFLTRSTIPEMNGIENRTLKLHRPKETKTASTNSMEIPSVQNSHSNNSHSNNSHSDNVLGQMPNRLHHDTMNPSLPQFGPSQGNSAVRLVVVPSAD